MQEAGKCDSQLREKLINRFSPTDDSYDEIFREKYFFTIIINVLQFGGKKGWRILANKQKLFKRNKQQFCN